MNRTEWKVFAKHKKLEEWKWINTRKINNSQRSFYICFLFPCWWRTGGVDNISQIISPFIIWSGNISVRQQQRLCWKLWKIMRVQADHKFSFDFHIVIERKSHLGSSLVCLFGKNAVCAIEIFKKSRRKMRVCWFLATRNWFVAGGRPEQCVFRMSLLPKAYAWEQKLCSLVFHPSFQFRRHNCFGSRIKHLF